MKSKIVFNLFIFLFSFAYLQFTQNIGKFISPSLCFMDVKLSSDMKCMELCIMYAICYSISYDRITNICRLNVDEVDNTTVVLEHPTSFYAKKNDFPQIELGCAKHTCNEQSACIRDGVCVPVFQGKKCKPPPSIPHSNGPKNESFPIGSTIKFTCDDGYGMEGIPLATCKDEETWSYDTNQFTCKLEQPVIRLVGGSSTREGRIEVYRQEQWGTVCDDGFDGRDGLVVCKMLGFSRVVSVKIAAYFGQGTGPILMDDVACTGSESSIFQCVYLSSHNCRHGEDVGVRCE